MSECGLYSILLQTEVERVWTLVYTKKQKDAIIISLDHLDKDFFQVQVGFTMMPWLDVPHLPITHIGDSLTANLTSIKHQETYTNGVLSIKPHLRGRRASVQTDQTVSLWLGTCLQHVHPHVSGGSNYYLAATQQLSRNDFFGQIIVKHDADMPQTSIESAPTIPSTMAPMQSPIVRPLAQIDSPGMTVKVEMVTLALDIGSKCILKEYI